MGENEGWSEKENGRKREKRERGEKTGRKEEEQERGTPKAIGNLVYKRR